MSSTVGTGMDMLKMLSHVTIVLPDGVRIVLTRQWGHGDVGVWH